MERLNVRLFHIGTEHSIGHYVKHVIIEKDGKRNTFQKMPNVLDVEEVRQLFQSMELQSGFELIMETMHISANRVSLFSGIPDKYVHQRLETVSDWEYIPRKTEE